MPILTGFIAQFFGGIWAFFAARMSLQVAMVAALSAITLAAYVAMKAAIVAAWALVGAVTSPAFVANLCGVLPGNVAEVFAFIVLVDTIEEAYHIWHEFYLDPVRRAFSMP